MKLLFPFWLRCVASLIALLTTLCPVAAEGFKPKPEDATLTIGNTVLNPVEVASPWRATYQMGTNRFFVLENLVQHPAAKGSKLVWAAPSEDGLNLNWLAAGSNVAYLLGYKPGKGGRFQGYEFPPRVRRLNLQTGQWLSDVPLNNATPADLLATNVLEVLPVDGGVIVLTTLAKKQPSKKDHAIQAYQLCLFKEGADKPAWTNQFPSAGERPYTGVYVWGIPAPQYARSDLQRLSWMGERLLVCPEAMQPIFCLNPDTGTELWRVDRVWEFQPGFIGPSVFSHYISRFGIEESEAKKSRIDQERKAFDKQFECALAGGPVSVPLNFNPGRHGHSVFVAALKGPAGEWAGYLSDCVLYELGDDGEFVSMVTLPRIVKGSQFCVRGSDVIWKCQDEIFARVSPSRSELGGVMGGGPDGLSNLEWVQHVRYQDPQAWFVSGKAGDPAAFGENYAYCVPGGGYVLRKEDRHYSFPAIALELSTGGETPLVLNVPFEGQFPLPTNNLSKKTVGNGVEFNHAWNSHLLAITGLAAEGNRLEISLGTETHSWVLSFEVEKALPAPATALQEDLWDSATAARARARAVDPKVLDKTLLAAIRDHDAAFFKALLEAGAKPKLTNGWDELICAAANGSAEMVDILIAAGSDPNAVDKINDGQTALMWAARSRYEAKQKVRSLLKSGADVKRTGTNGYNALMSAAGEGNLEVIECLLQAGMSISSCDHKGKTVLMAAAWSGKENVVSFLLQAGAEKNAKDAQGMTALMHAAEGVAAFEVVETLLQAGADPNLKDNQGRTALQIAEKTTGSEEVVDLIKPVTKN